MAMSWRIGIDEAGYGPNLGPLVVAATAWHAEEGIDLYDALSQSVSRDAPPGDRRLRVADSKSVYAPGGGLAGLERAVYTFLGQPRKWSELVDRLGADPDQARSRLPWHDGFDPALPIDLSESPSPIVDPGSTHLAARLVFPSEFNQLIDKHGTKGAALSFVSIGLARRLFGQVVDSNDRCELTFDKHGGRNRYGALVGEHFPDGWVETLEESRPTSRYRLGDRLSFRFRSKGEEELPVALASMTAKLLREISMRGFNQYWTKQIPGLKPTAGYPVDAKRFWNDIDPTRTKLGIDKELIWRNK